MTDVAQVAGNAKSFETSNFIIISGFYNKG
jgi:hypothetical protein